MQISLVLLGGTSRLYWARFLLKKGWEMSAFEALRYLAALRPVLFRK